MEAHSGWALAPAGPTRAAARARVHWRRLPLAGVVAAIVAVTDVAWKADALAAARRSIEVDAPGSLLKPCGTLLVGLLALAAVMLLPRLCVPGALAVAGGAGANVASLALWHGVPNPLALPVAGGVLDFNLADLCVWGGCLLFLVAAFWTIWRLPAERFA